MQTESTPIDPTVAIVDRVSTPSLCWRAIIAGTVATIGIHILLTALGVGAGLATFTPLTDENPVTNFSVGAAIVWSVCALIALWFGGALAGRFSHSLHSGYVHGLLVWSVSLIITLVLISAGTGMVLGGALKFLGEGLKASGQAVTSATGKVGEEALKRSRDQVGSFVEEASQSLPTNSAPQNVTRARREIGFAVAKLFADGNEVASPVNREAAIKSLTANSGMAEPEAVKMVDGWMASYKNLQAELERIRAAAEKKAREAADRAASSLARAGIWTFFALLVGLAVSVWGGSFGAKFALKHASADLRNHPVTGGR
jgi:hypothetical protein